MKFKFIKDIVFIFLITKVFLSKDNYAIDLNKYGKLTGTNLLPVIFDSHDFKVDDGIYIIVTRAFIDENIYYYFFDNFYDLLHLTNYELHTLDQESYNKVESNNDGTKRRYYTIEKLRSELYGSNENYLAIYAYMDGAYDIENTKKNKGNSATIIIVIIVVIIVFAGIIGLIVYCIRKRQRKYAIIQTNQNNPIIPQYVKVQNNYIPNNNAYSNGEGYNNINYNNKADYNNIDFNNKGYNNNFNNNQGYSNNEGYNSANINSNTYTSNKANVNAYNNKL